MAVEHALTHAAFGIDESQPVGQSHAQDTLGRLQLRFWDLRMKSSVSGASLHQNSRVSGEAGGGAAAGWTTLHEKAI